ncbi:TonB C-terminal domain-containing protein [Geomonas nitrogeniifigens]|uniref:TonB C-terminal domain-containing protein n=1 Tax=Geomonas diazotrophica TaxID=2843197 RepID=A0ABX8JEN2_9BACT|nr:energy transducer TonB [Geomonas nitrogeniifigens]QWV96863.1 TonB C-terminal domain-containing protein [Geomonas nitrogeniifigens]
MKTALTRNYPRPGGMLALSLVCHLVVFLIIANWHFLPEFRRDESPVTYVDMVTLPVAAPQSGMPQAPAPAEAKAPAAPAPAPAAPKPAMALPTKPAAKTPPVKSQAKTEQQQKEAEDRAFNERMAKLQQKAEERRQAAAIDALRKKGSARTGMPGATGNQAGSDYSSYLQSRLRDALKQVIATQTKAPQVIATITVAPDGSIDYRVEKGSGDPFFDEAVQRAVALAGKTLVPPPNRSQYKRVFRFMPEGVK